MISFPSKLPGNPHPALFCREFFGKIQLLLKVHLPTVPYPLIDFISEPMMDRDHF
jgi:hypothetical protein